MSEPFDPYSKWLGIEAHELPADHYRLLGLQRFESDPAVIEAAADKRMSHVRRFQTGPRSADTQKLLNELASARICLSNPGAKAAYDQVLQAVLSSSAAPPQVAQIASPPIERGTIANDRATKPTPQRPAAAIAAIVVLFVGAMVALALRWREPHANQPRSAESSSSRIRDSLAQQHEAGSREPDEIVQQADKSLNLDAGSAELHGPTLRLDLSGDAEVITEWRSMDDWVSWTFDVDQVPPQGVFHVRVTYEAGPESDGGKFLLVIGDIEKECEIRGLGEPVTDEYFLPVPHRGEQTLAVRAKSKPSSQLMSLRSVTLAVP